MERGRDGSRRDSPFRCDQNHGAKGLLRLSRRTSRVIDNELLEIGDGVYWNNDMMVAQLRRVLEVAERLYPYARLLFRFDNAPNHRKLPEDAPNVQKMNRHPGGKQPCMRATTWLGEEQELVFEDGQPKGIERILEERGIDTTGFTMNHADPNKNFRKVLAQYEDFQSPRTIIEQVVSEYGTGAHRCLLPKYHCELNPIEMLWSASKDIARKLCSYDLAGLRKVVPSAITATCLKTIKRFSGKCRRYEAAYRAGIPSLEVANQVRLTSHRRVRAFNSYLPSGTEMGSLLLHCVCARQKRLSRAQL